MTEATWVRERTWRVQADLGYPEQSWYAGQVISAALRDAIEVGRIGMFHPMTTEPDHD